MGSDLQSSIASWEGIVYDNIRSTMTFWIKNDGIWYAYQGFELMDGGYLFDNFNNWIGDGAQHGLLDRVWETRVDGVVIYE